MTHSVDVYGQQFQIADYDGVQDAAEYVKVQLGRIVQTFRFDTIYDSLTGYPVAYMAADEMRIMLDQIWHSELVDDVVRLTAEKMILGTGDLVETIESGIDQLRIRMLATLRPTPALAFQRDKLALERVRRQDPHRIASYLLIRLLVDNEFQRFNSNGLEDILRRHESAIAIGRITRKATDSPAMAAMIRQLIELDARFNLTRIEPSDRHQSELHAILGALLNWNREAGSESDLQAYWRMIENKTQRLIADEEIRHRHIDESQGNRAMRPAFIELTHDEVIAKLKREADEMRLEEQAKSAKREIVRNTKLGKIRITESMLNIDMAALLGTPPTGSL